MDATTYADDVTFVEVEDEDTDSSDNTETSTGIAGFFGRIAGFVKRTVTKTVEAVRGFFGRIKDFVSGKISNFRDSNRDDREARYEATAGSGIATIGQYGFATVLAKKSSSFCGKISAKIARFFKKHSDSAGGKFIGIVTKVLCCVAGAGFLALVLMNIGKLIPAIVAACAKGMAIAAIIELVYSILGIAVGVI